MRRRHAERGSASIFTIGMAIVLLVCAGLVVDGGLAINARMRVADDAEQAARVGADSIDIAQLRDSGTLVVDEGLARDRAASYLRGRGYSNGQYRIDVNGNAVEVAVQDIADTSLLKLVNINSYEVNAAATSVPETEAD